MESRSRLALCFSFVCTNQPTTTASCASSFWPACRSASRYGSRDGTASKGRPLPDSPCVCPSVRSQVARYGPFVMNTQAEIRQAIMDYQSGRFGKEIAGAEERSRKTEQARNVQKKTGKWSDEL